ncbi:MAG: hypothetical protein AB1567_07335 [bacterium]
MKKNMIYMIVIISLLVFILSILSLKVIKGFIPLPIGVRHVFNRIIAPKDLYYPIVTDNFLFHEKGFTNTYLLHPKYLDLYELGFSSTGGEGISSKYKFKGKIQLEFFWKDKLLFKKIASAIDTAWYAEGDMTKYKAVSLMSFEIPLQRKYKNDVSIKLTVLEPDQELKKYGDSIKLYIAVSATP